MRRFRAIAVVLVCGGVAGCGGEPLGVAVSGSVNYKGKPLREGAISFIPVEGTNGPSGGANIDDGTYAVPRRAGLAPGKYRVEIRGYEESGKEQPKGNIGGMLLGKTVEMSKDPAIAEKLQKASREMKNIIPRRYNETSELTKELPDQSKVTIDFEL